MTSSFLDQVRSVYASNGATLILPTGCTSEQIAKFQACVGATGFSDSFWEIYRRANGSGRAVIGVKSLRTVHIPYVLESLEDAIKEKELFPWAYEHLASGSPEITGEPRISFSAIKKWIPFARDKMGIGAALFFRSIAQH